MIFLWLFVMSFADQEVPPFKPSEEFELNTKYEFRHRFAEDKGVIEFETHKKSGVGPLPYLELELKILKKQIDEARIRVTSNTSQTILNRKLTEGMVVKLDLGFTADIKDRITAHEYEITFITSDRRKSISRIAILIQEDGTFFVNNENRGRL